MNFPEKVTFRVIDNKTKKTVENVAILLILYAHKKNNYSIEAKISDNKGEVDFTKQDCINGINSSKSFYLMDYVSTLEECLPRISVEIISRDTIDFIIKNRRGNRDIYKNHWNCSEEFLKALEATSNSQYENKVYDFTEADLLNGKILEIELVVA